MGSNPVGSTQETLDRVELVDSPMSHIGRFEREAALIQRCTQGVYRRRSHAVQFPEVEFGDLGQLI